VPLADVFRREPAVDGLARLRTVFGLTPPPEEPPAPEAAVDADPPTRAAGLALASPGPRGLRALVLLGAVALALGGWFVWRARPRAVEVAPPTPVGSASADPVGLVVVDVAGAVRRPGLVRLPLGSRVADAITAAGGLAPGATSVGLNLARTLADGEQVLVAPPGTPLAPAGTATGGAGATTSGKLDLNLATADQLDGLPGVGPVLAERIVAWRTKNGRFASVDQLGEVSGIGDKKLDGLRDLVTV
jgi:competence protein ComEA